MNKISLLQAIVSLTQTVMLLTVKITKLILVMEKIPSRLHSEWIDSNEVCNMLHIQPNTLYKNTRKYNIPTNKIGKKCYYKRKDIDELMKK